MTDLLKAKVHAAKLEDAIAITEFLVQLGLSMPEGKNNILAHWDALWRNNPALKHHGEKPELGWILKDDLKIVGFFGNIPQVSYFKGSPVRVSSARAWAVNKSYRNQTNNLCEAFFNQAGADVVLISSANAPAGKRCLEFGASAMPQPDYEKILFWVLNASSFLRAGLKKKGYGGITALGGGLLGAIALNARMRLGGHRPFSALDGISIKMIDEIDHSFDVLWGEKLKESPDQFLACRNAETLRWYFKLSQSFSETRVVCHNSEAGLDGYAILVREDAPDIGLKRLKISDLFVSNNDPAIIDALLTASYEYGLARNCDVLEVIGLEKPLRTQILKHKPFSRQMAVFPFYFKALREDLITPLSKNKCWSVSAYDGDTALL
jgi:hypothetical protein